MRISELVQGPDRGIFAAEMPDLQIRKAIQNRFESPRSDFESQQPQQPPLVLARRR